MARADENEIALLRGHQGYPAQYERAHEELAEDRIRLHDRA